MFVTRVLITLSILFLLFTLQIFRVLNIAGIQINLLLIGLVTISLAIKNSKENLAFLILALSLFLALIFLFHPLFFNKILILEALILVLIMIKKFLTGTFLADMIISIITVNIAFYITTSLSSINMLPWKIILIETAYNLIFGLMVWYFIIYPKKLFKNFNA